MEIKMNKRYANYWTMQHNNVVATIIHNEYKDVLLNNKYIRHSM